MAQTKLDPMGPDANVGCARFRQFVKDMKRFGWDVPGESGLVASLTVAIAFGDDDAIPAITDLFEEHGVTKWAHRMPEMVESFRRTVASWSDATRRTFLRHCREKNVYRKGR